jgi:hypothetical protein
MAAAHAAQMQSRIATAAEGSSAAVAAATTKATNELRVRLFCAILSLNAAASTLTLQV